MVSDRLRYTEDITKLPPATEFLARAFAEKDVIKGIICHGMWLVAPLPELVRGRPVVAHNNLHGDVVNMGAIYTDQDVVIDGDLVTGPHRRPLPPVRARDHRHDRRRQEGGAGTHERADPESMRQLIAAGRLAHLATIARDGHAHVSIAWVGLENDQLVIGTMFDQPKLRTCARYRG